ncbi:MAG: CPBP family intramembrane metalloprotease [Bacilli bacterium]|nr:CPBP family intramembrane metalloprotease [Bacilli bacterium]
MKYENLFTNIFKLIISLFLFFESIYIQKLFIWIFHIKKITPSLVTVLSFTSNLVILILLFLLFRKDIIKEFRIFKNNISNNIDIGFKYWLIGLAGMMISNILITIIFQGGGADNEQQVQKMIQAAPLFMILNAGLIAPINEEILFRKNFRNIFKNNIIFILVSGIFFGYLHVSGATSLLQWIYIIPYSSLGIGFAIMYSKTNTVFTSICMHMMHNTVLTLISILL